MKLLKNNTYNVLIPVPERKEFLLFNTLTGGIEILNEEEGALMGEIMSLKNFNHDQVDNDIIEYLYEKEYLIEDGEDMIELLENHTRENQFKNAGAINLTIGTTITCNMGCSYCFEFVKPNHTLKDQNVKTKIVEYIEQIIQNSGKKVHTLSVTWYGGEPLINVKAIEDLSVGLVQLAETYQLKYAANVITNGIYLTKENVDLLVRCKVNSAQITIDGAREVHDRKRPLKQKKGENYFKILRNISEVDTPNLNINLRLNVDKEVASCVDTLLDDFYEYGIWPHKNSQINFDPAWLRSYEELELSQEESDKRMHVDEFFEFKQNFRLNLISRYNKWAAENNRKTAKLKWDLPVYQSTCATWASPISLVVDPNGYVHKCWETIHDETEAPTSVFEPYSPEKFSSYSAFNRYTHHEVCRNCSYLPICDKISCSHEALRNTVPQCTEWKYKTKDYLKVQYLRMTNEPESITKPMTADFINSGHSNK